MMYRKLSIFTEVDLRMKYQVCAMENTLKQKHGKKKKKYSFTEKSNSGILGRYRFLLE